MTHFAQLVAVYQQGRHTRFRGGLRERGARDVLGVPCNTAIRDLEVPSPAYQGRGRRPKAPWQWVRAWRNSLPAAGWTHLTVRDGEKGPVEMDMVKRRVQTRLERKRTGPAEWLVVTRRPLSNDRYCYRYSLTPTWMSAVEIKEPSLAELARVITAALCIETSLKRGKGEAGMDEYQVRTWQGWHHHMVLSLTAVWFLIGETHRGSAVDTSLDTTTSTLRAERAPAGRVLHTRRIDYICRQVYRQ